MARNGRNGRSAPTQEQVNAVREKYLQTGDLATACAELGVSYDAIDVVATQDHWANDRQRVKDTQLLDAVADNQEQDRLRRRANALHRELAEDVLVTLLTQWRARWKAELAEMTAEDVGRAAKSFAEAVKALQFVQRISLNMDTDKIGSDSFTPQDYARAIAQAWALRAKARRESKPGEHQGVVPGPRLDTPPRPTESD